MPEASLFGDFHFLRPAWLWLLVPIALNYTLMMWRTSAQSQWKKVIAPHLLEHLLVGRGSSEPVRPEHLITALMAIGAIAIAGPTWEREPSPFAQDTAPLVIALDMSASMDAVDVQPSRLERSKQKIRDLLETRRGSRSALIAYSGTAHSVLPLSDDPSIFESFLDALETDVMPVQGKAPAEALDLAEQMLAPEDVPGSILFVTDGISVDDVRRFADQAATSQNEVLVLAVGTTDGGPIPRGVNGFATDASGRRVVATLDREGLDTLRSQAGAFVVGATVDNADVERLQRRVQTNMQRAQQDDGSSRWRDAGYWLTIPTALLGALWFRRGWTVRWNVMGVALMLGLVTMGCAPDLWLTPDQQGRRLFEQEQYAAAAESFEDPLWRGIAHYRARDFAAAIVAFSADASPEASYNMGNALALLGNYGDAVASYEQALLDRPDWTEAGENRDLVKAIFEARSVEPERNPGVSELGADEIQFDDRGEQGERGEVEASRLTDAEMAEMWMRRLQTSPADFLRRRFAIEVARADAGTPGSAS